MAETNKKKTASKQEADKKSTKMKKDNSKKVTKKKVVEKESLWTKFMTFCHGVKSEFGKTHWPSKKDMVKYSVATIVFIVFFALFFYAIDVIFALIQTLFK